MIRKYSDFLTYHLLTQQEGCLPLTHLGHPIESWKKLSGTWGRWARPEICSSMHAFQQLGEGR